MLSLILTLRGQMAGTASGTPDPEERIVWAIAPFVIIGLRTMWVARSRANDIFLFVIAMFLVLTSLMYTNDEMRLTYVFIPMLQIVVVVPTLILHKLVGWLYRKFRWS